MVKAVHLCFVLLTVQFSSAAGVCTGAQCVQLDTEDFGGASHLLQLKSSARSGEFKEKGPVCEKDTGGTCQFLGCDGGRNAECINGQCLCAAGLCVKDGVCVAETTTTEATTTAEPTTETTTEEPPQVRDETCSFNDHVQCPGSDTMCNGDQCCPGIDGGDTFPCPSASADYAECSSNTKVRDCLVSFFQDRAIIESSVCEKDTGGTCQILGCDGGRNAECINGQCLCAAGLCVKDGVCVAETTTTEATTTAEPTTETTTEEPPQTCSFNDHVQCPGSDTMCNGDQCCPGIDGGDTFPCPSASADYAECSSHTKVRDCLVSFFQDKAIIESSVCEKDTGGTCQFLGCDGGRNAECINGQCLCAAGLCVKDGVCVAETTTTEATTTAEPTTETTTEEPAVALDGTCSFNDHVQCPGSDTMCNGDQCCPGFNGTDDLTFPCPSASSGYAACARSMKVRHCMGI